MSSRLRRRLKREKGRKIQNLVRQPDPNMKKVLVCICCRDMVHTAFAVSLEQMTRRTAIEPDQDVGFTVLWKSNTILTTAMNELVDDALRLDTTHTLWIDSDMIFPPDTLLRLLKHPHPIVGINAMNRRPPYNTTAQHYPETGKPPIQLRTTEESTGLEKVFRTGFCVIQIATEVFQKMPRPWFTQEWIPERGIERSPDYTFLNAARDEYGYEIYIDHDLSKECMHQGMWNFSPLMVKDEPPPDKEAA